MLGVTHLVFAAFLYVVIWRVGLVSFDGLLLGFAALGSLLPDIDHPNALIYQWEILPKWLSKSVTSVAEHRGMTHTLWAAIIASMVSILLFNVYLGFDFLVSLMIFLGYASHLATDSLTKTGVAWLRPLRTQKIRFEIATGSTGEQIFFYLICIVAGILFFTA